MIIQKSVTGGLTVKTTVGCMNIGGLPTMKKYVLPNGKEIIIREARKDDAEKVIDYVKAISYESE